MLPGMVATCTITEWSSGLQNPWNNQSLFTQRNTFKTVKLHQISVYRTWNIMNLPYNSYRVCLYIAYRISTVDLRDLDPTTKVHFGRLICMGVNHPKRVIFSLQGLDTWQLVYGLGRSPTKTTYHLRPAQNLAFFVISLFNLKVHENIGKPRKMALD